MPRYIDKSKLLLKIQEEYWERNSYIPKAELERIVIELEEEDVAPVVHPVVHAKWIVGRYCSNCEFDNHKICSETTKYCPDCGAKMDESGHQYDK